MPTPESTPHVPPTAAVVGAPTLTRIDLALGGVVAAIAFAARLAYLFEAKACPLFHHLIMDARQYWEWGGRIAGGDWMGDRIFYQAPLYPYLLGVLRLIMGDGVWNVRVVQAVLGALACAMLFFAGRLFFGRVAGILAGLALALYAPAIFYDSIIQKAALGTFFTALLMLGVALAFCRPGAWRFALVGLSLALLALTREETILLAPVLGLWSLLAGRGRSLVSRVGTAAAFGLSLALPLGLVMARNHHVGGEFVLTTSQAGPNFYIGNNPQATGLYAPLRPGRSNTPYERQDAVELAQEAMGRTLTSAEVSRYWSGRAFDFIRNQPGDWLHLMGRKTALLINAYEVPDAEDQYFYERYSPLLRGLSRAGNLGVLMPIAGVGLVLAAWRRPRPIILYAMLGTLCVGIVAFYLMGRYRFPIVPVLILFAAGSVTLLPGVLRSRAWVAMALALLAGVGLGFGANVTFYSRDSQLAASFTNAGAALAGAGDDAGAVELLTQALAIDANAPETLTNLATAQYRLGRVPEAMISMQRAVALRPDDPRLLQRLGTLMGELGRWNDAATHLARAAQLSPQDRDSRINLIGVYLHLGRWADAVDVMRTTLRYEPDDDATRLRLAWTLATCTDANVRTPSAAIALVEPMRARVPLPEVHDVLAAAYAAAGRFPEALTAADEAARLAHGDAGFVQEILARKALYEKGKALHEGP
jgi:Flp pilus assembly protein TadD